MFDEFSIDNPYNWSHTGGKWNRLIPLNVSDPSYASVEQKFYHGWKHPNKPMPKIHAIFKVIFPEHVLSPYLEYRRQIQRCPSLPPSAIPGNEQLLFHGTTRLCRLGEDRDSVRLCSLSDCFLCCVIRGSFDIAKCGKRHSFRRFGMGIYTSACSSKADDYSVNGEDDANYRVMLLNRVVVGRPWTRRQNATHLTEPPCGFHSVVGLPGTDLNYEETVVYMNDAIRPAYLVVYGNAPDIRSKLEAFISALFKTPLAS